MTEEYEMTTLRNGSEEIAVLVNTIMFIIRGLLDNGKGMIFYELVKTCRDRNHKLLGVSGEQLKKLELITVLHQDRTASVHNSIRNIVLSCAKGYGIEIEIINPVATAL